MSGLRKICQMYGSMEVSDASGKKVTWLWDYVNDKPRLKTEMSNDEIMASEKAKWMGVKSQLDAEQAQNLKQPDVKFQLPSEIEDKLQKCYKEIWTKMMYPMVMKGQEKADDIMKRYFPFLTCTWEVKLPSYCWYCQMNDGKHNEDCPDYDEEQ